MYDGKIQKIAFLKILDSLHQCKAEEENSLLVSTLTMSTVYFDSPMALWAMMPKE